MIALSFTGFDPEPTQAGIFCRDAQVVIGLVSQVALNESCGQLKGLATKLRQPEKPSRVRPVRFAARRMPDSILARADGEIVGAPGRGE
jgi:hypothetical protein